MSSTEKDIEMHVNMISATLPVSNTRLMQITEETDKDTQLQMYMENIQNGWPPGSCPLYYHIRHDLSVVDGLLLKQNRIVITHSLRKDMLQIHEGHHSVEKCKR